MGFRRLTLRASSALTVVAASTFGIVGSAAARDPETVSMSDKAAARAAMDLGDELAAAGKHREALTRYLEADAIMDVPSTGILVGQAHEKLGHLVEARDAYLAVGRYKHTPGKPMPKVFVEAQAFAAERAAALVTQIPTLTIVIEGLPPEVTREVALNGEPINVASLTRRVNPGEVTVTAKAKGYVPATEKVTLAKGETQSVTLTLVRDPSFTSSPPPNPNPVPSPAPVPVPPKVAPKEDGTLVPAIVAFAIGGAALVVGGVTGGLAFGKNSELETACPNKTCSSDEARSLLSDANTLANISNVTLIAGGVGVALGVVFIFVFAGDDASSEAALYPIMSPEMVGVGGQF